MLYFPLARSVRTVVPNINEHKNNYSTGHVALWGLNGQAKVEEKSDVKNVVCVLKFVIAKNNHSLFVLLAHGDDIAFLLHIKRCTVDCKSITAGVLAYRTC